MLIMHIKFLSIFYGNFGYFPPKIQMSHRFLELTIFYSLCLRVIVEYTTNGYVGFTYFLLQNTAELLVLFFIIVTQMNNDKPKRNHILILLFSFSLFMVSTTHIHENYYLFHLKPATCHS